MHYTVKYQVSSFLYYISAIDCVVQGIRKLIEMLWLRLCEIVHSSEKNKFQNVGRVGKEMSYISWRGKGASWRIRKLRRNSKNWRQKLRKSEELNQRKSNEEKEEMSSITLWGEGGRWSVRNFDAISPLCSRGQYWHFPNSP